MTIRIWGSLTLISAAALALACLNDSDSISMEAAGLPKVIDVIAGRFERNPDLYYEMRLARVTKELEDDPSLLGNYDDAAVACDRLGRSNEAIEWMDKKWEQMESMGVAEEDDARYRYWANIGTVRVHKWLLRGAEADEVHLLMQSYNEIKRAVEINPEAHFGREWVQLELMGDMLTGTLYGDKMFEFMKGHKATLAPYLAEGYEEVRAKRLEGLLGIVVLGKGWESEVVWSKIMNSIGSPGVGVQLIVERRWGEVAGLDQHYSNKSNVGQAYVAIRANGDEYVRQREEFMLARLQLGKHPDTDDDFWDGYEEVPKVDLTQFDEPLSTSIWKKGPQPWLISLGIAVPLAFFTILYLLRKARVVRI